MTLPNDVAIIQAILRDAVALSLNENKEKVVTELKDLTKTGQIYAISGSFRVVQFFIIRTGNLFATIQKTEKGYEITSLKIEEEKGL